MPPAAACAKGKARKVCARETHQLTDLLLNSHGGAAERCDARNKITESFADAVNDEYMPSLAGAMTEVTSVTVDQTLKSIDMGAGDFHRMRWRFRAGYPAPH